jgi:hypothetical protein
MVEVFKTDVTNPEQAMTVLAEIRACFIDHDGNFDLQDCDHILRVKSQSAIIYPHLILGLLAKLGHNAEVLTDEHQDIELQMP